ncbi:MAG: prepilin-type N-terminal cleavage/methylation domain-containing protein [bacterium]|nr:prepilin-type N-terminal cleavage/methylation domain-containing protein [bacterium]
MNSYRGFASRLPRGFTLIELLVVMAIIGILSSIVLTSLGTSRQKARDARRVSDIKQLQLAIELYYDANGTYPLTIGSGTTGPLAGAGYISVIPTDPSDNDAYRYAALGDETGCYNYHLGASLEYSGNSAFSSDVDAPDTDVVCTGGGSNFPGADSGKCWATDTGVGCYDVKP